MTQTATAESKSAEGRRNAPQTKIGPGTHPVGATPWYGNQALLRMRGVGAPALQRKCACGGSGESGGECAECNAKHESNLQRAAAGSSFRVGAPPVIHNVLRTPGQPLDPATRAFMEQRFGRDFSGVRLHTDAQAARSARAVGAQAYTVGRDVVFARGSYAPGTNEGRRLLAHELTHTLQQSSRAAFPVQAKLRVNEPGDTFEQEADRVADQVMRMTEPSGPVLQRQGAPGPEPQPADQPAAPTGPAAAPGGPSTSPAAPAAGGPACPTVPPSTPAACSARHDGYCASVKCFPTNRWLGCVCGVSQGICDAVDAFHLDPTTARGAGLVACLLTMGPASALLIPTIRAKGDWFLNTNQCIWGHWRAALDALNDPSRPIPPGLTPEWNAAVGTCRSTGLGSPDCCKAHVTAEQNAIDRCSPYDSSKFGKSPTDVPGAPACSLAASIVAPGPAFTGDFALVADRIKYGNAVCCP